MARLTYPDASPGPRPGPRLGWVIVVAVFLCTLSVVVLTLMVPDGGTFDNRGGYLPLSSGGR